MKRKSITNESCGSVVRCRIYNNYNENCFIIILLIFVPFRIRSFKDVIFWNLELSKTDAVPNFEYLVITKFLFFKIGAVLDEIKVEKLRYFEH